MLLRRATRLKTSRITPRSVKRLLSGFTAESTDRGTILVPPSTPTSLQGSSRLDLVDGNDLLLQFAPSSLHVIPEPIDVGRFKSALSRTLAIFPTAAGRLNRSGDDWRIDLTNSEVPVTFASSSAPYVIPPSHARYVVQPSSHIAPYVKPVDLQAAIRGEDAPLISFKVTQTKDGKTVIGNSWNHVLGDGATLTRFMHTLSAIYANQPPPPPPVFHKRAYSPISDDMSLVHQYAPHVQQSYPFEEVLARYGKEVQETSIVDLYFRPEEVRKLWDLARGQGSTKVTKQDALSAYLVTLHNRCLEKPIHTVMNLMDVRHLKVPANKDELYRHPTVAGSCTAIAHAYLFDPEETAPDLSLQSIAHAVRNSTIESRNDPTWVQTYLRVNSSQYIQGVKSNRFYMYPPPGAVLVNSLMGVDRNKLTSFGCDGRSQFYTDTSWERMFRVHPANPVCVEEGEIGDHGKWDSNSGAFVVSFRVQHELKEQMLAMKEDDMRYVMEEREFPIVFTASFALPRKRRSGNYHLE